MEITLEQVELLKAKANVSYRDAKTALERNGGNLLDALIWLEDQGYVPKPEGTRYTTREETPPPPPPPPESRPEPENPGRVRGKRKKKVKLLTRLRWLLLDTELEIWRKGQPVTGLPLLVLILLLLYLPWATFPLLILGLFIGFRYRFAGPEMEPEDLNDAMDKVADTAEDLGQRMAEELRNRPWRPVQREPERKSGGDWLDDEPATAPQQPPVSRPAEGTASATAGEEPQMKEEATPYERAHPSGGG